MGTPIRNRQYILQVGLSFGYWQFYVIIHLLFVKKYYVENRIETKFLIKAKIASILCFQT